MVSNGNEGWRAYGPYDTEAPQTYPFLNWMNSGLKGAWAACAACTAVVGAYSWWVDVHMAAKLRGAAPYPLPALERLHVPGLV